MNGLFAYAGDCAPSLNGAALDWTWTRCLKFLRSLAVPPTHTKHPEHAPDLAAPAGTLYRTRSVPHIWQQWVLLSARVGLGETALALDSGMTQQDLMVMAANDLFKKFDKAPIAI